MHDPPRPISRGSDLGAVSVSLLLWLAVAGVLLYALFGASGGDADRFGEVPVPGAAILELPGGEVELSYTERITAAGAEVQPPADLRVTVVSTATRQAVEVDARGSSQGEQDGRVVRLFGSVNPPAAGTYEVRATSTQAAGRADPRLAFGDSPFGAIGDRLSRVGDLLTGPLGILLAALVIMAVLAPRAQRILRRRGQPSHTIR